MDKLLVFDVYLSIKVGIAFHFVPHLTCKNE